MLEIINIVDDYSKTSIPVQQSNALRKKKNVKLKTIYLKKSSNDTQVPASNISIIKLIKAFKKDCVILTHHTKSSLLILVMSFLHKINWVHFVHNDVKIQSFWKRLLLQLVIKRSRKIVCNSKTTKINLNEMLRIGNRNKIFVNYNGIELDKIEKLIVSNKFSNFTILFVGRLVKEKSVETLIDAINLIKLKYQHNKIPFDVKIVGDGPYYSKLVSKVNHYCLDKQIQFLGLVNRNSVYKIMKKSHCLVSPSKNEGFCNVNIEALACGLKVIASDINIFKEVGKNNFIFFKQGSAKSLMEEICTLYELFIMKKYKNKINKKYLGQFTLKKNVTGILDIIKQEI